MTTMHDVARVARVSIATVSRVLNQPALVSERTRVAVMDAIDELGFSPNHTARSLRMLRTSKIIVTVPDIANPFFSSVIQGVEDAAQRAGYAVLLGDVRHDSSREDQYAAMLLRQEADGLIFLGHRLPEILRDNETGRVLHRAVVNGCEFSETLGVPSVHIDNAAAAEEAIDHLHALGHRRIGVVTGPMASPISRDRLQGARTAAARLGIKEGLTTQVGDFSIDAGLKAAQSLLRGPSPPTAIFCFSDEMALGVLAALRDLGLSCPTDISVIGFDDIRYATYAQPGLTTIHQPMAEIGREAVTLLLRIIGRPKAAVDDVKLDHRLVVRASTGRVRSK